MGRPLTVAVLAVVGVGFAVDDLGDLLACQDGGGRVVTMG